MSTPVWFVKLLQKLYPARFSLAKATHFHPVGRLIDRLLFYGDDIVYLPKDRAVIAVNSPLEPPESMVLPSQVVDHFIRQARVHWIMNFCICRAAEKCKNYPIEYGCLFLGEAALGINPKLGRRVSQEEALDYVRRCREAGLVHLIGRNKLDTIWLNIGPGSRLLTICNCCPCCCLWRILPHITPDIGSKVTRMPGVQVAVSDRCVGCGACAQGVCFVDAIRMVDGRAVIGDGCRGCGRCVEMCPAQAIDLTIADPTFVEQTIRRITPLVDLS